MPHISALVAVGYFATAAGAGLSIAVSIFYMRVINNIALYLKAEKLESWRLTLAWPLRSLPFVYTNPGKVTEERGPSNLVLGLQSLNISDVRYRRLLWIARKWLIVCAVLWVCWIALVSWLFQNAP